MPPTGRFSMSEKHHRSLCKGISWRIIGTVDTTVIAFLVTGQASKALSIGLTEVVTKVFLYYAHERIWQRVGLGRHRAAPAAPRYCRVDAGSRGGA